MVMGTRQKWVAILVMLAGLLLLSADLGYTNRGGHRHWGHGHRGHGHWGHKHWGHWHGGSRVFISPSIVVPFGPFWGPYWGAYPAYPPVVAAPPVYVQPSPPAAPPPPQYWYYCDSAKAYYPYVAQCPSGWRAVPPTPP